MHDVATNPSNQFLQMIKVGLEQKPGSYNTTGTVAKQVLKTKGH